MIKLFVGACAALAVICLGVISCGTSEEEATAQPLTKTEFVKQADAVCARYAQDREAAFESWKKGFPGGYPEARQHLEEGFEEVVAPSMEEQAADLKALTPPARDEAEVARMIGSLSKGSQEIAEEGMKGLSDPSSVADFEREAEKYGLKVCPNP
jgi:hypothetical protein